MNILLTGGAGYIGSHTALVLTKAGHQVVILDNFCNGSKDVLKNIQKILNRSLPFVEGDTRNTALLIKCIQDFRVDAVIHFAGLKAVGESAKNPVEYYANNVQGTISLMEAMEYTNVTSLVFSSSATVYGEPQYLPIDEYHPTGSTNPYGRSKLHIEEMLKDLAISNPKWRIMCLRYFNPVGAHESGFLGEKPLGIPNNLMPYIAQVAMGKLSKLNIYGKDYMTPDGSGIRDYIHVMDLAAGHEAALNYLMQHHGWDVVNLGTGNGYSVFELITAFNAVSGRSIPFAVIGRRSGDVAACIAKVDKAKNLFGWKAKKSLDEMCASTWLWQKNCTQEFD